MSERLTSDFAWNPEWRGVVGTQKAINKIAPKLPKGTRVVVSGYAPPETVYVLRDEELAAFIEFTGVGRRP